MNEKYLNVTDLLNTFISPKVTFAKRLKIQKYPFVKWGIH